MRTQKKYKTENLMGPKGLPVKILNYFLLTIFVFTLFMPIIIVFFASFKGVEEYTYTSFIAPPQSFLNFENYQIVFETGKMLVGFKNTAILSVVAVVGSVTMGTMVAFALGRFEFKLKKPVMNLFLLSTIIPSVTTQVATFTVINGLGLYNTIYAGMVLYIATDIMQIYIFLQFVTKIPKEIDESGLIDGASYFKIYTRLIFPQLRPAIATVVILKFVAVYNDMFVPYIYMPKSTLETVTTAIMAFSYDKNSQWQLMAAGIIVVLLPVLILYVFLQKYIIAGVTDGAVKG